MKTLLVFAVVAAAAVAQEELPADVEALKAPEAVSFPLAYTNGFPYQAYTNLPYAAATPFAYNGYPFAYNLPAAAAVAPAAAYTNEEGVPAYTYSAGLPYAAYNGLAYNGLAYNGLAYNNLAYNNLAYPFAAGLPYTGYGYPFAPLLAAKPAEKAEEAAAVEME